MNMKQSGSQKMTVAEYKKRKPSKYGNVKVEQDGEVFDSKKEARRYGELLLLQRDGQIMGLTRQVKYPLNVHGKHICDYIADFYYCEKGIGSVIEDVKSVATRRLPAYRIKFKLMEALYGTTIREV